MINLTVSPSAGAERLAERLALLRPSGVRTRLWTQLARDGSRPQVWMALELRWQVNSWGKGAWTKIQEIPRLHWLFGVSGLPEMAERERRNHPIHF